MDPFLLSIGTHSIRTGHQGISPVNHILLPLTHEICDFHPLPCPLRTSRFLPQWESTNSPKPVPRCDSAYRFV